MKHRVLAVALLCSLAPVARAQKPIDWPSWRGPNRDAICKETGLLDQWPEGGPPLAWRTKGFGQGFSSVTIAGCKARSYPAK